MPIQPPPRDSINPDQRELNAFFQDLWVQATNAQLAIVRTVMDAAGDLVIGKANNLYIKLPRGGHGTFLMSDSTAQYGLSYQMPQVQGLQGVYKGLYLENDFKNGRENTRMIIKALESVIMDDGAEIIGGWDGVYVDTTAVRGTGNALDLNSTLANNTWYALYIARNPTTDARTMIAHQERTYNQDELMFTRDSVVNLRDDASRENVRQGFSIAIAGKISHVLVHLQAVSGPPGYMWVNIETLAGTVRGTSRKVNMTNRGVAADYQYFVFDPPVAQDIDQVLYFVFYGDWPINGVDYVAISYKANGGGFTHGTMWTFSSTTTTWTNQTPAVVLFDAYVEREDTPVKYPAGFTQHCFLGWNKTGNSDSNWMPMMQDDRHAQVPGLNWVTTDTIPASNPSAIEMRYHCPPGLASRRVKVDLAISIATAGYATFGRLDCPSCLSPDDDLTQTWSAYSVGAGTAFSASFPMNGYICERQTAIGITGNAGVSNRIYTLGWYVPNGV